MIVLSNSNLDNVDPVIRWGHLTEFPTQEAEYICTGRTKGCTSCIH